MDEALHHLFVGRDIRIQEFENQALVDHLIFHQEHGPECTLADLFDVAIAAIDYIARLEFRNVQYGRRCRWCSRLGSGG